MGQRGRRQAERQGSGSNFDGGSGGIVKMGADYGDGDGSGRPSHRNPSHSVFSVTRATSSLSTITIILVMV